MSHLRSTAPLNRDQQFELIGGTGLPAVFVVLVGGYVVMALLGVIPHPPLPAYVVIAVVLSLIAYQVVQAIRDLVSGVALIDEDVLVRSWRASGFSNDQYAKFERLGTCSLRLRVAQPPAGSTRYRVTYSPASKIVWSLEPLEAY